VEGPAVCIDGKMEPGGDSPMAHLLVSESGTAGPSTSLRSGRDDKFEGGGPPRHGWRWIDHPGLTQTLSPRP
jgi:hypothetical protein